MALFLTVSQHSDLAVHTLGATHTFSEGVGARMNEVSPPFPSSAVG